LPGSNIVLRIGSAIGATIVQQECSAPVFYLPANTFAAWATINRISNLSID
jgi:hypothetical protein